MDALDELLALTDPYKKKENAQRKPDALDELLELTRPGREDTQSGLVDTAYAAAGAAVRGADAMLRGGAMIGGKGIAGVIGGAEEGASMLGERDRGVLAAERKRLNGELEASPRDLSGSQLAGFKSKETRLNEINERIGGWRGERLLGQIDSQKKAALDAQLAGRVGRTTDAVAQKIKQTSDNVLEPLKVDVDFQRSLYGKFVGAVGQQLSQLPAYAMSGGAALATNFTQIFSEGYDDAKQSGADDDTAFASGVLNLPGGALEYVADKFALGNVFNLVKAGKVSKQALGKKVKELVGAVAGEAGTEGLQQVVSNVVARDVLAYDPSRARSEGVGESALIGGMLGGAMRGTAMGVEALATRRGGDDTGMNVPESRETLAAQQAALIEGRQAAQMFPNGTSEMDLPDGFERVETPRGVFHFDPDQLSAEQIMQASAGGRENEVLGLGPASKQEIAARARAGEPVSTLVETDAVGREVKASLVTPSTLDATRAEMQSRKAKSNTLEVKRPGEVVADRGGMVADLLKRENQAGEAQKQAQERERAEREARRRELTEKRGRFDEVMQVAGAVYKNPQRSFSEVQGALTQARNYAEDNALGLAQEQKEMAQRAVVKLTQLHAQMEPVENARREVENRARMELEAEAEANRRKAVKQDQANFKVQQAAGIGADGGMDYGVLSDQRLAELAEAGDRTAVREFDRRAMDGDAARTDQDLRSVLAEIKLPTTDAALGGELALLKQELKPGEAMRFFSAKRDSLDRVAEALRERGFSQIQTPDDVVRYASEAFRGQKVMPTGRGLEVEFAAAAARRDPLTQDIEPKTLEKAVDVLPVSKVGWEATNAANRARLLQEIAPEKIPNADLRQSVEWDREGLKHSFGTANGPVAHAILGKSRDIIERAKFVGSRRNNLPADVAAYHGMVSAIEVEGKIIPVRVTVEEKKNGALFVYNVQAIGHKKTLVPAVTDLRIRTSVQGQRTVKVGDLLPEVKRQGDGKFSAEFSKKAKERRRLDKNRRTEAEIERAMEAVRRANPALLREYDIEAGLVRDILKRYATEAGMRLGKVPDGVQAAVTRVDGMRGVIALGVEAFESRAKTAALLTHEVAHVYWDTLPDQSKRILRELRAKEISSKSGPLYVDGKLKSDLDGVEDSSEWGVKEWFAERVARLNEAWAAGRIDEAAKADTLLRRVAYELREFIRKVWDALASARGIDPESALFEQQFRRFWLGGVDADVGLRAGMAFAQSGKVEFAQGKEERRGPLSDEEMAAKVGPASALPGAQAERSTQAATGAEPTWLPSREELSAELQKSLPKIDRKAALLSEWREGKAMRDEGLKLQNEDAIAAGQERVNRVKRQLDDEFTGWEAEGYASNDVEPSPFIGEGDAPLPMREGIEDMIHGQSASDPSWLAGQWAPVKRFIMGFRGAVPELPTFASVKADEFTREHGAHFYDRFKAGYRMMNSINDYVQKGAEEQVSAIVKPLIEAGGAKINANDYARLKRLQERMRVAKADGQRIDPRTKASAAGLQAKLEASPYVLFQRLVLMLDLNWRQQNLKDSKDNPIQLPGGINQAEVKAGLERLSQKMEASPHRDLIAQALEKHIQLVKATAEDLKGRDLMAAEQLQNPFYFPHLTLEVREGSDNKVKQRELRIERVKPGTEADFRGYLLDPVGSTKPIETDYVRAMYYHLVQVGAHNQKADVVRDYFRSYDVKAAVEKRAEQLSKQRGQTVSWEQAFNEEFEKQGYVRYGTESGDPDTTLTIDREKLAQRLGVMLTSDDLHKQLEELGVKGIRLLPGDVREMMQMAVKETWILPARVAEALRSIDKKQKMEDGAWDQVIGRALAMWKGWKLFAPMSHIRYEFGNIVADAEKIFSTDPAAAKYLYSSAKELSALWKGGMPSETLRAAMKEGVLNSITAQDMKALPSMAAFEGLQTSWEKARAETKAFVSAPLFNLTRLMWPGGVAGRITSVEQSALREGITRYAKFKADLSRINAGVHPKYSGSYWKNIDAMGDSRPGAGDAAVRKAAAISKATFGDYGDVSESGAVLRKKLITFYSWIEVNFKYHANVLRNLHDMVRAGEKTKAEAVKAGAQAAAVFAAGMTSRAAGAFVLRLALPYVTVALWNSTFYGDLEDELSEDDRRKFHIILGRREDGKVMVITANTALMDVMKWFSGPEFLRVATDWMSGRTDFSTAFDSWRDKLLPDLANNTVGSFGPLAQIPAALGLKKRMFPDVTDPRTIPDYDMRRVVLGMVADDFTADMLERVVNKDYYAAKDFGDWAMQLILQVRQRDPESWAYYSMRDKAASFTEEKTGAKRDTSYDAPDQQVLRNFRKAIYAGDVEAATGFYLRALDYGYTAERFAASVRAQDPLAMLAKKDGLRKEFVAQLSEFDREQLKKAFRYYERMDVMRGRERALFPSDAGGDRALQQMQQNPRTNQLQGLLDASMRANEAQLNRRAEQALQRSLR